MNMKTAFILIVLCLFSCFSKLLSVTKTVGTAGDYATLKAAFDDVNNGTLTGDVVLQIISNTTESAIASLQASGTGSANYSSVYIYPTGSGYTISANIDTPIIELNGADFVTIDGRVSGNCTDKDLTISNSNTGAYANAVRFINSATINVVKYCNLEASTINSGVVQFSTSTSGSGNSYNTIANCDIKDGSGGNPTYGIISSGSSGMENQNNSILNNNIYDFWKSDGSSFGVYLSIYNNTWLIKNNSFYQTASRTVTSGSATYSAIYCTTFGIGVGDNFKIIDNYIGGSTSNCGGSAWRISSAFNTAFTGVYLWITAGTPASIQGNTIKNIDFTTARNANCWNGIFINTGNANIGTLKGNTFGAETGTGSITCTSSADGASLYGIYSSGTSTNVENNTFGSITTNGTSGSVGFSIKVIVLSSGNVNPSITNNLIGSLTTSNSINASSSYSGSSTQTLTGIESISSTSVIENNVVANLNNNQTATTLGRTYGIQGSGRIANNQVYNLSTTVPLSVTTGTPVGILASTVSAPTTISGNEVYNLSNDHSGASIARVHGIIFGNSNLFDVYSNHIYNLSVQSTNSSSSVHGIMINGSASNVARVYNNIISLSGTKNLSIIGIYDVTTSTADNVIYYNDVYLSSTVSGTATAHTHAFYKASNSGTTNIRNNIFYNNRTNTAGTAKHYAIYLTGTTGLTIDYNDYYAPGTGGTLGYLLGTGDVTTLAGWKTATGQDVNSQNTNPSFNTAGGTEPLDYICATSLTGTTVAGVSTDYFGSTRGGTPKMGAIEGFYWLGTTNTNFSTASNWYNTTSPSNGISIGFHPSASNNAILSSDISIVNFANDQSTYYLDLNDNRLTLTGKLEFTNDAKIDAVNTSSTFELAGTDVQYLDSSNFINGEIDNLIINNENGVVLLSDVVVNVRLTLLNGILKTGNYKVILKDGATIEYGSDTSYVNGTIQKIGNEAFTFHVGDDDYYAPFSISAPSLATDVFTASYENFVPGYNNSYTCIDVTLDHISFCEVWNIERTVGTSNVSVTLSWDERSCGVTELNDMRVAHWDGTEWVDEGNTSTTGTTTAGTVTSNVVTSFSPFTLASTTAENPLPVELLKMEVVCSGQNRQINWSTLAEVNNDFYDVEKSYDGKNWKKIGSGKGSGNSNVKLEYSFWDDHITSNDAFYRLKQVDLDGRVSYSRVVSSNCYNYRFDHLIEVFPNPANQEIFLSLRDDGYLGLKYCLKDALGRNVLEGFVYAENTALNLNGLSSGVYYLFLESYMNKGIKIIKK